MRARVAVLSRLNHTLSSVSGLSIHMFCLYTTAPEERFLSDLSVALNSQTAFVAIQVVQYKVCEQ